MGLPFTLPKTNDSRIINETADYILVKSDIEEPALNWWRNLITVHMSSTLFALHNVWIRLLLRHIQVIHMTSSVVPFKFIAVI
jgi:hypothetical protein